MSRLVRNDKAAMLASLLLVVATLISGCAALVVGGAGSRGSYPATAGTQDADAKISMLVRRELGSDRMLEGTQIKVTTQNGVVTLEGSVSSYSVRSQAETLTAGVAGVTGILNRLSIAGGM